MATFRLRYSRPHCNALGGNPHKHYDVPTCTPPTLPLLSTPHNNELTLKCPKFSTCAQPHRPPVIVVPRQVSWAIALSDSANDLWHADLVSLLSCSHSLSVSLSSLTNTPSHPRSQRPLNPLKSPAWSRWPVCRHM